MARYIMALDAGTTSNRCILFQENGQICSSAQKEFTQYFPKPGWVEHGPPLRAVRDRASEDRAPLGHPGRRAPEDRPPVGHLRHRAPKDHAPQGLRRAAP